MPNRAGNYFVVLPDSDAALPVVSRLTESGLIAGATTLRHPSGRPWVVAGSWAGAELIAVRAGDTQLALIGQQSVSEDRLRKEAEKLCDVTGLDDLALRLPGSYHMVALAGGRSRVQGTASGLRLVFHTRIHDVVVAADRADVLAVLSGAPVDERGLAARLLHPVPYPLDMTSLWRDVWQVTPDSYLLIERAGSTHQTRRWWTPPPPELPLAQAAPLFREALCEAVAVRARPGQRVCCDLSGGFDSTTVCFLAARTAGSLVALTVPGRDPADEDLIWARRAAGHLPTVEHDVLPIDQVPLLYDSMLDADDPLDEPAQVVSRSSHLFILRRVIDHGSSIQLGGHGGDHVLSGSASHLRTLLLRRPVSAMRMLRGFQARSRWSTGQSLRMLLTRESYAAWLRGAADDLVAAPAPNVATMLRLPKLGWDITPRLPLWATPDTVDLVREMLRQAASTAQPLGPTPGQHADLHVIQSGTRLTRPSDQITSRVGVTQANPYFDDRVIEAALAVRPEDRTTPWQYKPLLRAAMDGIVPRSVLERTNKAEGSIWEVLGRRKHRLDLIALFEDSQLGSMGLIDDRLLRLLRDAPTSPELDVYSLYATLRCEMWLRTRLSTQLAPART